MKQIFKIMSFTGSLWPLYVAVSVSSITIALMNLTVPWLSGQAIDELRLGSDADTQRLIFLAAGIFALDLGVTLISNLGGFVGDQMGVRLKTLLSTRYYQHLLTLPQSYFDTELSGKIIARLNRSIEQISRFMTMMSNNFLQFILTTVLSLFVIAFLSWQVALMLALLYPIFIWMTVRSSSTWQDYQKEKNEHLDVASGRFAESIGQVKVLKSFVQEAHELKHFTQNFKKIEEINIPQSRFWHSEDVKRRLVLNVIFFGVYAFIFTQGANGSVTPGEAVALILYAMQIRIPIFTISFLVESTQKAIADSKDYFEVMLLKPAEQPPVKRKKLDIKSGKIGFKQVNFTYEGGEHVLRDMSFEVPAKKTIALVGESGQGKTTLTHLLLRLYLPQSGIIEIDGQDIMELPIHELRRNIGVVFQDPSLFSGSIKENIAYARPDASDATIEKAAKAANAHEFIQNLSDGYDTAIGERGLKLSGGQKQRIAIARALLKDAPILILDEATSSLDTKSEQLVQEALDRLMKNRTTIIIAHRLSTIADVDLILTVNNGVIEEMGSPDELAKTKGVYANLLAMQQVGSVRDKKKLKQYDLV